MAICCPKVTKALRIRITANDECGAPIATPNSQITFKGFTRIEWTPEYEEGESLKRKNAEGDICLEDDTCAQLTGLTGRITLCTNSTPFDLLVAGAQPLLNAGGDTLGVWWEGLTQQCENYTLEFWGKNAIQACGTGTDSPYVHYVITRAFDMRQDGAMALTNQLSEAPEPSYVFKSRPNINWVPPVPAEWADIVNMPTGLNNLFMWQCTDTIPDATECAYSV